MSSRFGALKDTHKLKYAVELRTSGDVNHAYLDSTSSQSGSEASSIKELSLIEEKNINRSSREIQRQESDNNPSPMFAPVPDVPDNHIYPDVGSDRSDHGETFRPIGDMRTVGYHFHTGSLDSQSDTFKLEETQGNGHLYNRNPRTKFRTDIKPTSDSRDSPASMTSVYSNTHVMPSGRVFNANNISSESLQAPVPGPSNEPSKPPNNGYLTVGNHFHVGSLDSQSDTFKLGLSTRNVLKKKKESLIHPPEASQVPSVTWRRAENASENEKKPRVPCWGRVLAFFFVVLVVGAAIAVYIYFRNPHVVTETQPVRAPEKISCTRVVQVDLRENITINCNMSGIDSSPSKINITAPYAFQQGSIHLESENSTVPGWMVDYDDKQLTLGLGPAGCHANGWFELHVYDDDNERLGMTNIFVNVTSTVSDVQLEVALATNKTDDLNVSCSVNSGCSSTLLKFLDNGDQELRGLDFTCRISYNDYQGYDIECSGTVPQFILKQLNNTIGCEHTSSIKERTVVKRTLKECDIENNCNYKCTRQTGEYFTVDKDRCDIFHRCVQGQVYTTYCSPGTFFSNTKCACAHRSDEEREGKCTAEGVNINASPNIEVDADDCGDMDRLLQ